MVEEGQQQLFRARSRLRHEGEFRSWLEDTAGFKHRSATDVVSRVRRAMRFADILEPASDHELRFRLEQCSAYRQCSSSVRSQLKRAASLYREFRQQKVS